MNLPRVGHARGNLCLGRRDGFWALRGCKKVDPYGSAAFSHAESFFYLVEVHSTTLRKLVVDSPPVMCVNIAGQHSTGQSDRGNQMAVATRESRCRRLARKQRVRHCEGSGADMVG